MIVLYFFDSFCLYMLYIKYAQNIHTIYAYMYLLFPKRPKLASQCIPQCQVEDQLSLPQPFCRPAQEHTTNTNISCSRSLISLILERKIKSNNSIQDPNIGRDSQVSFMWLYTICSFDNIEPTKWTSLLQILRIVFPIILLSPNFVNRESIPVKKIETLISNGHISTLNSFTNITIHIASLKCLSSTRISRLDQMSSKFNSKLSILILLSRVINPGSHLRLIWLTTNNRLLSCFLLLLLHQACTVPMRYSFTILPYPKLHIDTSLFPSFITFIIPPFQVARKNYNHHRKWWNNVLLIKLNPSKPGVTYTISHM